MSLYTTFHKVAKTAFRVFKSLQLPGVHVIPQNKGWGNSGDPEEYPMTVILSNFSKEEAERLSFRDQVVPTDTIIMIKGSDVATEFNEGEKFKITHKGGEEVTYTIKAWDTDPAKALYLVLLRGA